ncbi:MAG TPA: DMT family protein [Acetivibrio clariflavus]|nr:DMT family protein [Acetivibrio clariflavus]HPU41461.1 DMT family protein [Acetivibrio clariflavus]
MLTVFLLLISNIFMTFAWYGHLKYKSTALPIVVVVSWLIAFVEYCFQVPANRIGSNYFTAFQLKIIQEVLSLSVFTVFSILYLKESLRWNYLISFLFIIGAVFFAFKKW